MAGRLSKQGWKETIRLKRNGFAPDNLNESSNIPSYMLVTACHPNVDVRACESSCMSSGSNLDLGV